MSNITGNLSDFNIRRAGMRMELKMLSEPAALRPVRLAFEEFGRDVGLDGETTDKIALVLNEAMANVMRHGYGGAVDKPIIVTFERQGGGPEAELDITIRDWAKPFDPAKLPVKPVPTDPDQVTPGGLGLLCMRQWMDEVVFTPLPDGMLLKMVKKFRISGS